MSDLYHSSLRFVNTLDRQEWFLLLGAVMVVGIFCMRGFGSRSGY